jgi:hypothetical protein
MDSKDFSEYLKNTLSSSLKLWENTILTGTLSKDIPYERAVGIITAFREIVSKLDAIYANFKKGVSADGDSAHG